MTATTAAAIRQAFIEHREEFGTTITIGTATVIAVVADADFGRELKGGGFAETGDISVKYLLADVAVAVAIGNLGTFSGRGFRVLSVGAAPGSLVGECTMRPARR